jgi:hypothetical protein
MFSAAIRWADWLDTWLKANVGWPYNTLLGIALGTGIVAAVNQIQHELASPKNLALLGVTLVFQVALLINQLAQLHNFREERRARREARQARRKAQAPTSQE